MEEHIEFNPSFTMLTLALAPGESVRAEAGAMVCQSGVEMKTGMSGGGGIGGFFKSMAKSVFTSESFFLNTFTAGANGGWVSLAPGSPGDIAWFDCQPGQNLFIQSGSYLASTPNVETDTKFQGFKGMFSGERLFFIRAFTQAGAGRVYYNSYGAVKQIQIQPGQIVTVDTGHVVAFTDGVDYQIGKVGGMGSLIFGGEGLVMHFSGQGTVWVQTRNIGALAGVLAPFFPPSRG
ncbi:MAG: TIGR00266 family protein [Candidatus Thalassarchaeaceae archaeon]|nr:TIGR00266 family protein [Candidatus Thalassarchaeaceae archaeon]